MNEINDSSHKEILLDVRSLGMTLDGEWLWRERSLMANPGDRWFLVGPSGSGKSLFLRALVGLIPISEGDVFTHGRQVGRDLSYPEFRAEVQYLPQGVTLPEATVEQALAQPFAFAIHRRVRNLSFSRQVAADWLEKFSLPADFLKKNCDLLSGGERQVIALIRALMLQPRIILLDEAQSAMDAELAGRTEAILLRWVNHGEHAFIGVSHDSALLERLATHTLPFGSGGTA